MRLHMALKSNVQVSMGPKGVEAQSMLRANWICRGRAGVSGNRVQSKDEPTGYRVFSISAVRPSLCAAIMACLGGLRMPSAVAELEKGRGDSPTSELIVFVASPK